MIYGIKNNNFDPYSVILAIATNIPPQRLKTGFVPFQLCTSLSSVYFHCMKVRLYEIYIDRYIARKVLFSKEQWVPVSFLNYTCLINCKDACMCFYTNTRQDWHF